MLRTKATNKRLRDEIQYNREEIIELFDKKCGVCSFSNDSILEIHHILPLSRGGSNDFENLSVLCPNCHRSLHKAVDLKNTEEAIEAQSNFYSHNKEEFLSLVIKSYSALRKHFEIEHDMKRKKLDVFKSNAEQLGEVQ